MFCFSFYEDISVFLLIFFEVDNCDKWFGEVIFLGFNYN